MYSVAKIPAILYPWLLENPPEARLCNLNFTARLEQNSCLPQLNVLAQQ